MRSLTLRTKMILAVSLLVAAFISLIALLGLSYFERQIEANIGDQQFTLVSALARQFDNHLLHAQRELLAVASSIPAQGGTSAETIQRILDERKGVEINFDNGLYFCTPDGTLIAGVPRQPELIGQNFAYRNYFQQTLKTGLPQISEPFFSTQKHGHPVLVFTAPVRGPEGQLLGILGGSLDLLGDNALGHLIATQTSSRGDYLYLFDQQRRIIVHPDRSRILIQDVAPGANVLFDRAIEGFEGSGRTVNFRGIPVLSSFKRLATNNWILAGNYPEAQAFAPLRQAQAVLWPAVGCGICLSVLMVWALMARLTRSLQQISDHVGQLGPDEPSPLPEFADLEMATLAGAFNQRQKALAAQREELNEQLHFLQVLLDTMPNPIFYKDAELKYLGCNRAFERFIGIDRGTLLGKTVHEIAPPELAAIYDRADRDLLGNPQTQVYESKVAYPDGEQRDVIFYKTVFYRTDGRTGGLLGTFLDISERKRAEAELQVQKNFSENLVQNSTVPAFVIDTSHRVVIWNRACEKLTGIPAAEMLGSRDHWRAFYPQQRFCLADFVLEGAQDRIAEHYEQFSPSDFIPGGIQAERWISFPDGRRRYLSFSAAVIRNPEGEAIACLQTLEDLSEQRQTLEKLNQLYRAVEQSTTIVMITDREGDIEYVNPRFSEVTGYTREEAIGRNPRFLKGDQFSPNGYADLWQTILAGRTWRGEFLNRKKSGELYWESASISPVRNSRGEITHLVAVKEDITERKQVEKALQEKETRLQFLAHHDPLTGLPNRILLEDRLRQAIAKAQRDGHHVALMFLDIDRFKVINDSLGHGTGDQLLRQVGERIRNCVRSYDTVARFGGDEFVIVLEQIDDLGRITEIAGSILQHLSRSIHVANHEFYVTASIGISLCPEDGNEIGTLLSAADIAMYRSKENGGNGYTFSTAEMNARSHKFQMLETNLRRALEQDQLVLHYQPQIDLASRRMFGVEALVRWQHPEQGMVSPADFIPLAEDTGLIVPIGRWVLETACRQAVAWQQLGYPPLRMAVNISGRQFKQPDFVDMVDDIVAATGISPQILELEITESVLMENVEAAILTLTDLRVRGYHLSIDDFGTGYSSLSYLKRLPISKLKIDRSFVRDLTRDSNDAAIVASIIALTESMDMDVIAEGIEEEEQVRFLLQRGCLAGQGFLFSKPLACDRLQEFMDRDRPAKTPGTARDYAI